MNQRLAFRVLLASAVLGTLTGVGTVPRGTKGAAQVELGRRLFYEDKLSLDGSMSCASCHEQDRAFTDGNRTHPGVTGEAGRRNVPGLANVGAITPLTWADPSQNTLEKQVARPMFGRHPVEMGTSDHAEEIQNRLKSDACYQAEFLRAFPDEHGRIDRDTIARALASFERTLVSFDSASDKHELRASAHYGAHVFAHLCASCHTGPLFTDLRFHRIERTDSMKADQGLFEVSGREADRGAFRTPSLRNVALTGPWLHDGSANTLAEAIDRHDLGVTAPDRAALIAFLNSLTDWNFVGNPNFSRPEKTCDHQNVQPTK